MVQASMLSSSDADRLTALVQDKSNFESDDDAAALSAPDAAAYKGHSGDIVDTLSDLLEKAETQLANAQKTEQTNKHNYEMLKQSLEDEITYAKKDMADAKKALGVAEETKSTAEGDLSVTKADLKEDKETIETLSEDC